MRVPAGRGDDMADVVLFSYREESTVLHRLHPLTKVLAMIAFSIALSLKSGNEPTPLTLLSCIPIIMMIVVRFPLKRYVKRMGFFVIVACIIGGFRYLATQQAVTSIMAVVRFFDFIAIGLLFADSTAADDLSRAIGAIFGKIIGKSGYRFAATVEIALYSLPLVFETVAKCMDARKSRLESAWKHPVRQSISIGTSILWMIIARGEQLADALEGRLFDPSRPRKSNWSFTWCDILFLLVVLLLLAGIWIMGTTFS